MNINNQHFDLPTSAIANVLNINYYNIYTNKTIYHTYPNNCLILIYIIQLYE